MKNFKQVSSTIFTQPEAYVMFSHTLVNIPQFAKMQITYLLLFTVLFCSNAAAQQKGTVSSAKQPASSGRPTDQNNKRIEDGRSESSTITDPTATSSLTTGEETFYIKKSSTHVSSPGSSICSYNAKTKITEDILKSIALVSNYNLESTVENIVLDKKFKLLYFTAATTNRRGNVELITWKYDINTKQLVAYKDGRIESVDADGNQTIVFEGNNSKGKFTTRSLLGTDGKLIKVSNAN